MQIVFGINMKTTFIAINRPYLYKQYYGMCLLVLYKSQSPGGDIGRLYLFIGPWFLRYGQQ